MHGVPVWFWGGRAPGIMQDVPYLKTRCAISLNSMLADSACGHPSPAYVLLTPQLCAPLITAIAAFAASLLTPRSESHCPCRPWVAGGPKQNDKSTLYSFFQCATGGAAVLVDCVLHVTIPREGVRVACDHSRTCCTQLKIVYGIRPCSL